VTSLRLTDEGLSDIQGFITSGYGHLPLTAYLFVKMTTAVGARRWLESVSPSITSSRRWPVGRDTKKEKPSAALNLGLTVQGLRACGLPEQVLCTFPSDFQEGIASAERSRILGDTGESAPSFWELGGPGTDPVHAVVIMYAANEAELEKMCRSQRAILRESGGGVAELPESLQRGYRPDSATEPFGFHDGVGQPSIAGLTEGGVPTGEFILGYENHYGLIPPTPVVPRALDPGAILPRLANPYHAAEELGDLGRNGSYVAYRKLQQDVAGFWQFMARETARSGRTDPAYMVWLASKCVGRWPSGAPLVLAPHADIPQLG
jgi:deferrochelatase/peroxidase EfeB